MKSVILIRHAKSNWDNPRQRDFDRPLNDRGLKDAPVMASRLREKAASIDQFISSPANRALTTAEFFAKAYGLKASGIIQKPELYHAAPPVFYDVIGAIDNSLNTIVLFSHNGGITDFINGLTSTKLDNMPTCGIFAIKTNITSWNDFFDAEKSFWFFDFPKNI